MDNIDINELESVVLEATADTMELVGELLADQLLVVGFNTDPTHDRTASVGSARNGGVIVKVLGQRLSNRIAWQVSTVNEDAQVTHPLVDGWEFKDGLPPVAAYQRRVADAINEWAGSEVAACSDKRLPRAAKSFVKTKDAKPVERQAVKRDTKHVDAFVPAATNNAMKELIRKLNNQLAEQPSAEGFVRQIMFDMDGEPVITEVRKKTQAVTA